MLQVHYILGRLYTLFLDHILVTIGCNIPPGANKILQVHYILGSTGRSFVVGYGVNPPTHCHHRGASCYGPNRY